MGVHNSAVTEMFKEGGRKLKLDEAARLVEVFDLERESFPPVPPLPASVYEAAVLYVATELGVKPDPHLVQELGQDIRAYATLVRDRNVADQIEIIPQFFEMMRLRRPGPHVEGSPENGTPQEA